MTNRAFQFRLKPNKAQQQLLLRLLTTACCLYNDALRERKETWETQQKSVSFYDQAKKLKELRRQDKELALLNHHACLHVLLRLGKAFLRFFNGLKSRQKVGYPRFKKPSSFRTLAFTYGNGAKLLEENGKMRLRIQNVGSIKVIWHRELPKTAIIKQVWLTLKADSWYLTFAIEVNEQELLRPLPPIDVGIENLLALSESSLIDNPRWYQKT